MGKFIKLWWPVAAVVSGALGIGIVVAGLSVPPPLIPAAWASYIAAGSGGLMLVGLAHIFLQLCKVGKNHPRRRA